MVLRSNGTTGTETISCGRVPVYRDAEADTRGAMGADASPLLVRIIFLTMSILTLSYAYLKFENCSSLLPFFHS